MRGRKVFVPLWLLSLAILLCASVLTRSEGPPPGSGQDLSGAAAGGIVTVLLLLCAALVRLLAVPKFQALRPGRFQILLEAPVLWLRAREQRRQEKRQAAREAEEKVRREKELTAQLLLLEEKEEEPEPVEAAPPKPGLLEGHSRFLLLWLPVLLVLLVCSVLTMHPGHGETVQEAMRDAVLHEENRIAFFGSSVNPALISAFTVTGILLVLAALLRIFVIPKFREVPGKLQMLLEMAVGYFDGLAKQNSPHRNKFLGCYIFCAGVYIAIGTLFELFGFQAVTTQGHSVALPAPLSDVNAAICMGCMSYLVIVFGGLFSRGLAGLGAAIKEFSLPISMSFRLFGALLSGLLVTELVYYYVHLSFVLPVVVGVLFTLLHAIIQTYVLTMLTSMYYGEVSHAEKE